MASEGAGAKDGAGAKHGDGTGNGAGTAGSGKTGDRVPEDRRREVERIIGFSDGVVSIAATLLVLPLVDVATEISHESVERLLSDNLDLF
jgi:hypothetical protein